MHRRTTSGVDFSSRASGGRRDGAHGGRKARAAACWCAPLAAAACSDGASAPELLLVGGRERASDVAVITL